MFKFWQMFLHCSRVRPAFNVPFSVSNVKSTSFFTISPMNSLYLRNPSISSLQSSFLNFSTSSPHSINLNSFNNPFLRGEIHLTSSSVGFLKPNLILKDSFEMLLTIKSSKSSANRFSVSLKRVFII